MNAEAIKTAYRDGLAASGEVVFVRRYSGAGGTRAYFEAGVLARVVEGADAVVVGAIRQKSSRVIVLYDDLVKKQFPVPITTHDFVVIRGKEMAVVSVDSNTRRFAGELIAYELSVNG